MNSLVFYIMNTSCSLFFFSSPQAYLFVFFFFSVVLKLLLSFRLLVKNATVAHINSHVSSALK